MTDPALPLISFSVQPNARKGLDVYLQRRECDGSEFTMHIPLDSRVAQLLLRVSARLVQRLLPPEEVEEVEEPTGPSLFWFIIAGTIVGTVISFYY